ncbi:MAG: DUF4124 domain-containing protein [Deltaproteobacteria bacterium]|nr:DUF4124 domain-containing protein [Deltaproteobacteria bacterium]
MKISRLTLVLMLLTASVAYAELYEWKGKDGVIHLTDDLGKVPESERARVRTHAATPRKAVEEAPPPSAPEQPALPPSPELYGDQSLEWWLNTFRKKREEMQSLQTSIAAKEQYVSVFDGGRRLGQTYGKDEVERYTKNKEEIPADKQRLKDLQDELDELTRKATIAGVPKAIREGR